MPVFAEIYIFDSAVTGTFDSTVLPSTFTIPYSIIFSDYLLDATPILANLLDNLSVFEKSLIVLVFINCSNGFYSYFFYSFTGNNLTFCSAL